jgi:hypothetical protein
MNIETPVSYKFSSHMTKYGIILAVIGNRAKVQWQAEHCYGSLGSSTRRANIKTTVAISKLSKWTERLRINDGMTLNPNGLEYRTPANA